MIGNTGSRDQRPSSSSAGPISQFRDDLRPMKADRDPAIDPALTHVRSHYFTMFRAARNIVYDDIAEYTNS